MANYYVEHKDEIMAKTKAYQQLPHRKAADYQRQRRRYLEVREQRNAEIARRREQDEAFRQDLLAREKAHYEANKALYTAKTAKRRAARLQATPTWCDYKATLVFYKEAERLTKETGVQHVVDHIVPLQGRTVCGLHVSVNLQVITAKENLRKFNKLIG
jgi:5-methylcytosine-specific restriction endonuclease McrA